MKILESAPKLSDKKVSCSECNSLLEVTNDDALGVKYCDSFVPETLSISEHVFGPDVHILNVPRGYIYTVRCPICNKKIEIHGHITYTIERHEYSY